ncbi:hypothetical protein M527_06600 [Sphingobium indicum IP26]|uniref:Uncharacterized protein n=1 Tax=Sphingobium indicum F2 TaxID=1450518 RepID=A0A8E0WTT6_9SPHN|nr:MULTISPECIES: hypothetical protein [Sphingobium]EPR09793.1 hypothetical protein M527_06600 [Sphingobium indicum IP26]KER37259.1 hypothetical protein AL00_06185 [Sphingobium indicum F2]MCB4863206.1 hypothetical protein [Sphingobium sp. PNB]
MAQTALTNGPTLQTLPQFGGQHREACMFVRSASYVKTTKEWAALAPRRSVESAAKRFARENMIAVVMLGNDDAVAYLYDPANDRVAKAIYRHPEWVA